MESLLAEQPEVSSALLGLVAVALIFVWMQTGKKAILLGGLALLLLIPVAFVVAANWVTDREQISAAIYRTADAVANNDVDAALKVMEPAQRARIDAARADLMRFHFDEARVNKLRSIDIVTNSEPLQAEVDMSVTVVVSDQRGQIRGMRVPRRVILQFRKSASGEWLVHDYNHLPIVGEPDAFSPHH
jgi:ketosteroid isomerase-like protein